MAKKKKAKTKKVITPQAKRKAAKLKVAKGKAARAKAAVAKNAEKYKRSYNGVALHIAAIGGCVSDIAKAVKVDSGTVYRWIKRDPSFKAAFEQGERQFEDEAESLYRKTCIDLARPHDVVSIKRKEINLKVEDDTIDVPAVETETLTKKGVVDVKGLADFIRRRRPGRYREGRIEEASDDVKKFTDWLADRNGSSDDSTEE